MYRDRDTNDNDQSVKQYGTKLLNTVAETEQIFRMLTSYNFHNGNIS